jgi:uncharacterized membrane protein
MMFAWTALVAFLLVTFQSCNKSGIKTAENRARETLPERFAPGKISHQEYQHIPAVLEVRS